MRKVLLLALLASAVLLVCGVSLVAVEEPAQATFPGENGNIVYHSWNDDGRNIYTISPSGGTPTQVTYDPGDDACPAYSQDGKTIVYYAWGGSSAEIYTVPASGGNPTKVTSGDAMSEVRPAFSPDGNTIVYAAYDDIDWEIFSIPVGGGTPTKLTNNSTPDDRPTYSPDGTKIAYAGTGASGNWDIYTIPASGGTPTQLSNDGLQGHDTPSYSPDGTKIAFTAWDGGDYEIYTMSAGGGSPTKVTDNTNTDYDPAWSPDSTKIVYQVGAGNEAKIYTISASGGTPTLLVDTPGEDSCPDWGVIPSDTSPPETTIDSGPNGPTNDDTPTFTFSGSDDGTSRENLKYSHKVDGGSWSTPTSDTSATLPSLSEGNHTFSVKAVDEAGNEDTDPASRSFAVDKTAPNVTLVSPLENATRVSRSTTVTATFSEEKININTLVSRTDVTPNPSTLKLEKVIAGKRRTAPTYTQVDVGVGYDETTKKVTLSPSARLDGNTTYRMTITTGVQDLAGNALVQAKAWTFKTASR